MFDAGVYRSGVGVMDGFGDATGVLVKGVILLRAVGKVLGLQVGNLPHLVKLWESVVCRPCGGGSSWLCEFGFFAFFMLGGGDYLCWG